MSLDLIVRTLEEFYDKGDLVPEAIYGSEPNYLWDDYKKAGEYYESHKESVRCFTVVDGEGNCYIIEGLRWANRLGYLFSRNPITIPDDVHIEY